MRLSEREELQSGHNIARKKITIWLWEFGLFKAKLKVKESLAELKPDTAPALEGMRAEFTEFLED